MTPLSIDQTIGLTILLAIIAFGVWHIATWVRAYRRCAVLRRDSWAYQDHQRADRSAILQQLEEDHRKRLDAAFNLTEAGRKLS